jgi:hypothetical protein
MQTEVQAAEVNQQDTGESSEVTGGEDGSVGTHHFENKDASNPLASKDPITSRKPTSIKDIAKAAETMGKSSVAPSVDEAKEAAAPEMPKYEPNYKFKVMDKEHEVPELLRGAIKDADTEKQVREILEKAYGLDVVKPRLQQEREARKTVETELTGFKQGITELREHYQRGDLDTFFEKLNIPSEKVLQWCLEKVQYQELPPEQRQALDARKEAERRAFLLEKQNEQMNQQYWEQVTNAKSIALDAALARADITSLAQSYDSRPERKPGDPGFKDLVINQGELAWFRSQGKVDLSPEQAIEETIRYLGLKSASQAAPAMQATPAPMATQQQATPAAKPAAPAPKAPVLPNISGRQASPMKSKPRSIDDLKKLSKSME